MRQRPYPLGPLQAHTLRAAFLLLALWGCAGSRTTLTGAQARLTDREYTLESQPAPKPPLDIELIVEPAHAKSCPDPRLPAPAVRPAPDGPVPADHPA